MTDKDALHLVMQEELSVSRSYNGSRTFYKKLCRYNRIMIAIIGGMLGLEGFLIGIFYANCLQDKSIPIPSLVLRLLICALVILLMVFNLGVTVRNYANNLTDLRVTTAKYYAYMDVLSDKKYRIKKKIKERMMGD